MPGAVGTRTRTTLAEPVSAGAEGAPGLSLLVMSLEWFASFPLPATGSLLIGRSARCDIQLDDALASRQHARIYLDETLAVEDLNSANRTRVRNVPIPPGTRVAIARGEAIDIGSTVLIVQAGRGGGGVRRIWSHGYFETRVTSECTRANSAGGRFALVRLRLERAVPWTLVVPVLARAVPEPHHFAAYGPKDYEFLLLEATPEDVSRVVDDVRGRLAELDAPARVGMAWYPRDGRSVDALLAHANGRLSSPPGDARELPVVAPTSRAMQQVCELAARAARSHINLLIMGETGVGKEVMAQMVHRLSPRADKRLLALNCASLSESLIESELFGHEKGAFTGASTAKTGLLEAADGGTLFLDEIGEMPLSTQARLLRAVESREVLPVGGTRPRRINVRFIAATNRDLELEQQKGTFRPDLFFRLNGITLTIPPLRERRSEIPDLAATFLAESAREAGRSPPAISPEAARLLGDYHWPGNIRELKNVIERAVVLCEGDTIELDHLPVDKMQRELPAREAPGRPRLESQGPVLSSREEAEKQRLLEALDAHVWNQSRTAQALNMSRRTLISKLDRLGIPRPQKGKGPMSEQQG